MERGAGRDLIITVGTMAPEVSVGLPLVVCSALFPKVGTTLMLGLKYEYRYIYNIN